MAKPLLKDYQYALVPALLLFILGALSATGFSFPMLFWLSWSGLAFLSLVGVVILAASRPNVSENPSLIRCFVWLTSFLLGGLYCNFTHFQPGPHDISHYATQAKVVLEGRITNLGLSNNQWVLRVNTLNAQPVKGSVLLKAAADTDSPAILIGQRVNVTCGLFVPGPAQFPGDFDYQAYLFQNRLSATCKLASVQIIDNRVVKPWYQLLNLTTAIRNRLTQHFTTYLPLKQGQIFASVVLGEHAVGLDADMKADFIHSGLIHVLSASGLNVGLIAIMILWLLKPFRLPWRINIILAMAGVALYCLLAGLPPSVIRAGTMLELAFLFKLVNRQLTPLFLIALSGWILTLWNPWTVSMLGFQLSFLSAFGIIVMLEPLQAWLGFYITRFWAGVILITIVAQLWVTPILMAQFSQIQVMSLPANLVAVPLVAILTYVGFLLGLLSFFVPQLTGWILSHLGFLVAWLSQIAAFYGHLSFSVMPVAAPSTASVLLMLGLLTLLAYHLHFPQLLTWKTATRLIALGLLLILIPYGIQRWQAQRQTTLAWLPEDYGAGPEIVIAPNQTVMLNITHLNRYAGRAVGNYLKHQGLTRIQAVAILSPRIMHVEGLESLLQSGFQIDQISFPPLNRAQTQDELIQLAQQYHVALIPWTSTEQADNAKLHARFFTLSPTETLARFETNPCWVFHWGDVPLMQSQLLPLAEGCPINIEEAGSSDAPHLILPNRQAPIPLSGFHQLVLSGKTIQLSGL